MNKLGFGLMRLPLEDLDVQSSVNYEEACNMIDEFLKQGFNYFDTAYMYHGNESETIVRKAIVEKYPREEFILTSKMPTWYLKSKEDLEKYFEEQLIKCGVSYFDYYLLHGLDKNNHEKCKNLDAYEFLADLKKSGKIKNTGFSYHGSAKLLEEILSKYHELIDVVQIQLNYLDWESTTIQSHKCYDICCKYNKKVIVMEPIKGGTLASLKKDKEEILKDMNPKKSMATWAINFAASHENVMMVLSGMSTIKQVKENTEEMKSFEKMTKEEYDALEQVANLIRKDTPIDCTGCNYCIEGCPQRIAIPYFFRLYNDDARDGWQAESNEGYEDFIKTHSKASQCIACGKCEEHCPQHLTIIENLKLVSNKFEIK